MIRPLFVVVLVFFNLISQAQWLGSSPSIAVNPKNTNNVVVSTSSNRTYLTVDNGNTWQESLLTSGVFENHVALIADTKGNFYAAYATSTDNAKGNSVVIQVSKNAGLTWEEPVVIQTAQDNSVCEPSISFDLKGNLYASWVSLTKSDDKTHIEILFSKSSGGKKWSTPSSIYKSTEVEDSENSSFTPTTAISADGKMYFVGWKNANSIWLDRSFNGGDFWLRHDISVTNVNVSTLPKYPVHVMPVVSIDASKSNKQGMLFFLWAEQRTEAAGVYFVRSTNLGDHWTTPSKISDDPGIQYFIPSCSQDFVTGNFYSAYYGYAEEEGVLRFYLASTKDGGGVFDVDTVEEYSVNPDQLLRLGNYSGVSAVKGTVALAWCEVKEDGSTVVRTSIKQPEVAKK